MRQTGALAGVRDLIMILNECDKALAGELARRSAEVPLPESRITPVVDKSFGDRLLDVPQLAETGEIGAIDARKIGADR